MTIEIGNTVRGAVMKVADYGAIVRLPEGNTGLIHISEIADAFVRDVRDYVNEGDEVTVKVLRIGPRGRFELSLKQCDNSMTQNVKKAVAAGSRREERTYSERSEMPAAPATFEDRLSRFLKDSEERMHDLKRHIESKRGRK
ncbi:MAG: S1 RNA-binding domain-containing protein [Armatimonadota bacterium]|nr:S1 RNA-binding domain-containing protein [bacterium]